jgi:hypothetical protein
MCDVLLYAVCAVKDVLHSVHRRPAGVQAGCGDLVGRARRVPSISTSTSATPRFAAAVATGSGANDVGYLIDRIMVESMHRHHTLVTTGFHLLLTRDVDGDIERLCQMLDVVPTGSFSV